MKPQGRVGDKAHCPEDRHDCKDCAHSVKGPAVTGSPDVMVNGKPALRVDDTGVHNSCCGSEKWTAGSGSATVFINGKPAHRMGDKTVHCGGKGKLIGGSNNVFVGDSGGGEPPGSEPTCGICSLKKEQNKITEKPKESVPEQPVDVQKAVAVPPGASATPENTKKDESQTKKPMNVSLVYLPETGQTLVFEEDKYRELMEDHNYWEQFVVSLQQAKTKDELTLAKSDIAEALQGQVHINKHGSNRANGAWNLTDGFIEGYSLAGKKWVYVRSEKMKNHRRGYDDSKRLVDLRDKKGRLSIKKIKKQFAPIEKKIKKSIYQDDMGGTISGGTDFDDFVNKINDSFQGSWNHDKDPATVNFDGSAGAQLMRYYGGASLDFGYKPSEGKIGVELAVSSKISLAEGMLKSSAYWPDKAGHDLKFTVKNKKINLGAIRTSLNFMATGFVGASAAGSLAIKIETEKSDLKNKSRAIAGLKFTGADLKDQDKEAPFTASGQFFAGLEAGGDLDGSTEWKNPENDQWKVFLKIGFGVTGSFGVGLTGELKIGFKDGHFAFRARAGAVLAAGGSGAILGEVDAGSIYEFIQFVYHKLKDSNFTYLDFIEEAAFRELTKFLVTVIEFGADVKELVGSSYIEVERWWKKRNETKAIAENLAEKINKDPELLKFTTPEAKGVMLYTLSETFFDSFEEAQEDATIKILERIQTLKDYYKVMEHMTKDGSRCERIEGKKRLAWLLDGSQKIKYMQLYIDLLKKNNFNTSVESDDIIVDIYQATASINSPVTITKIA